MTEEKPLGDPIPTDDGSQASDNEPTDGAAAALSALAGAAAPATSTETAPTATGAPVPPPPPESAQPSEPPAPTGAPVIASSPAPAPTSGTAAPNAAPAETPAAPQTKKKVWPWVLAICIVAGLVLIGGITACSAFVVNTAVQSVQRHACEDYGYDRSDLYNYDAQDGLWNYYYGGNGASFEDLLDAFNVEAGDANGFEHGRGAYRVSSTDGIAPGLYYLAGTQTGVSNFYVFDGDDDGANTIYDLEVSVEFFGNYYTELEEGDCIIYVPQSDQDTFHLATDAPMAVSIPYESGCYRVGIDIPAGTYTITANADEARTTDSESGAFVMKNLDFDADSIIDSAYVIKGGRQTITVKNGDYLELFAAIATPSDGTGTVPQRSEQQPEERGYPIYGQYDEKSDSYDA